MPLLVCGSLITPVDKHSYNARPNAYTYVNDDGIIEAILELTPGIEPSAHEFLRSIGYSGEIEVLRLAKGEFLIPGFIDTHIHAPQFPNIGAGQENELLKWLTETVFPMEAKFKDVDFAIKAYSRVVKRVIDAGVGPRKIREEVRRAGGTKSSDAEFGRRGKKFGPGQTFPARAKIRSDVGKKQEKSLSAWFSGKRYCWIYTKIVRMDRTAGGIMENS